MATVPLFALHERENTMIMENRKLAAIAGLLLLFVSGCSAAYIVHQTPLNYSHSEQLPKDIIQNPKKTLSVGDFKDSRVVTTPEMILNLRDYRGSILPGGWEAEKPIAEIVRSALSEGAKISGLALTNKGDLLLSGEIIDYRLGEVSGRILGGTFEGTLNSKLTVKLQLRDSRGWILKTLWETTFVGQASIEVGDIFSQTIEERGKYIKDGFIMALNDFVTKAITDKFFLKNFE